MEKLLSEVMLGYELKVKIDDISPYGEGHINTTYRILAKDSTGKKSDYILQRINTDIFKNPSELMSNIVGVTNFLRKKIEQNNGDVNRETMTVIPTKDGKPYHTTADGHVWRIYNFISDTVCLQRVENEKDFYTAAAAFGNFQKLLADYPADTLFETLPLFHHTPNRFLNFKKALEEDVMGRAKDVKDEIEFVLAREKDCSVLVDLLEAGKLPLKVTHNDTKLNNVLLDDKTREAICVIDLDTVLPGLAVNDYGDSIRFGANDCVEDEKDLTKVNFSLHLFDVYTQGFLSTAGDALTKTEKENLPWGAKLMTLECGMRFLTDHLQGDTYFKIHRENHNLDRCRTQFKLVKDMEDNWDKMQEVISKYM